MRNQAHLTRPGKDAGTSATWDGRHFYVFTSSTSFEPDQAYRPFEVVLELDFGGDIQAAIAALQAEGFGGPSQKCKDAGALLDTAFQKARDTKDSLPLLTAGSVTAAARLKREDPTAFAQFRARVDDSKFKMPMRDWYAAIKDAAARELASEMCVQVRACGTRPQVVLPGSSPDGVIEFHEVADELFRTLGSLEVYYARGGQACRVDGAAGESVLVVMEPAAFAADIQRHVELLEWRYSDDDGWSQETVATVIEGQAKLFLASSAARQLLPPILVVRAQAGLCRVGDELITLRPGYNPEGGGMYVTGSTEIPVVDVKQAASELLGLLCDFDFVTEGDRARAVAALLTPELKMSGLIKGNVPIEFAEADRPQSGKGFLQQLRAFLYGETPAYVSSRRGGVGSLDESLNARLVEGKVIIIIDNLRGKVDSPHLEAIITATGGTIGVRVPHCAEVQIDPSLYFFSITSNDAKLTLDLVERCSVTRLRKQPANYQWHEWPVEGGGLLDYVRENQPYLLGCVHSVVRAWWASGCPRADGPFDHSFKEWAGILSWITENIFEVGPLLAGHREQQERMANPHLGWLREVALRAMPRSLTGEDWTATRIAELCAESNIKIPGLDDDSAEKARQTVGIIMRGIFADGDRVEVDGVCVRRTNMPDANSRMRPVYSFRRVKPSAYSERGV